MKNIEIYLMSIVLILISGCTTSGIFSSANLTNVELSENNYQIVAKNVSGESSSSYILGYSYGFRGEMQTIGLIRLSDGDPLLYKTAIENLWNNFENEYGEVEGRSLALVNVRFDSDALNVLGFYTQPKISVRADVVEFTD